jgi:uncharacterized protein YbjT (DUF2867 family)
MEPDLVVAVVGATGRQGGAVTRHLIAGGWRVRGLTRRPDSKRVQGLAESGAEVVRADMADVATLRDAFRDAYGVFSVQNPMTGGGVETEVRHGRNVADAAKAMGVQHLVYGSAGTGVPGTGVPEWESKLVVQTHMEALGLPITVLRPTAFMELMTDKGFFPPVSTWHLMPKLMGADRRVPWLGVDDLGHRGAGLRRAGSVRRH